MNGEEKKETSALEEASQTKNEDAKALEHIQQVLDKTSEEENGDGDGGEKSAGHDTSEGEKGTTTANAAEENKDDGEGTGNKPEDKTGDGDNPDDGNSDGDKNGEGDGDTKPKGDEPPPDDKVKALLDSDVFANFRKDGVLSQEEWGTLMDGIEALLKEVADGREKLREISAYAERQRTEEFSTRLDSVFDGLGDEFAEAFGKGSASKLDKALMDNRNEVLKKAETLILGYKAQGKEVTLEDAVKEAAGLWASQNFKRPQEKRQQDRRGQFISKPAGDRPPSAKGDDAALDFIEKFQKQHGE